MAPQSARSQLRVEPCLVSLADFPDSARRADGMAVLPADHTPRYGEAWLDVEYARKSGRALHVQLLLPAMPVPDSPLAHDTGDPLFPLLVFVQGSAWQEQVLGQALPALSEFSSRGYVVAIVEYRLSGVASFPAQVRDVRTAVRFLQDNAARFHVDPGRIAMWGDSSGAHTAVLTVLTEHDPEYRDEQAQDTTLGVSCVVDYYGPSDIRTMNEEPSIQDHVGPTSPEGLLIGGFDVLDRPDLAAPTVIASHVTAERAVPPVLIVHGSKDRVVPFGQSVLLYEALNDAGHQVQLVQLHGADHGGPPFWQSDVLDMVHDFICSNLPGPSRTTDTATAHVARPAAALTAHCAERARDRIDHE